MSLSDKPECFGGAQLVLLTARPVEPPGALPCHRPSYPKGIRRWRIILASALIRQGGGYNERPVSKASRVFLLAPGSRCSGGVG